MGMLILIFIFFLILFILRKNDLIEPDSVPIILVIAGFALAGWLGVSNY